MPYFGVPIRNGLPIGLGTLTALAKAVAVVVPPVSSDPFFEYVSLLLNTTSTNGAQNNTFLDSSTNAFSITRNGNTTQGTFSPFSQTGWSNYFDGTGDYLSVADNAALQMGSGDFTIEFWWNPASIANFQTVLEKGYTAAGGLLLQTGSGNGTIVVYAAGATVITASSGSSVGVWDHYALVRSGTTMTLYRNGASVGSATNSTNFNSTASLFVGGSTGGGGYYVNGYISNARIVKGTAVYTSNFTPPTAPLTAITNTSLLTCQSNRFIDNSSNAFTITRNGDVSVQAFSPFNPTAAWSASTNGGSGYFDGTGDFLATPAGLNTAIGGLAGSTWTIESWVYVPSISASNSGYTSVISCYQAAAANGRWWFGYAGTTSFKVRFTYTISTGSEVAVETTNSFALNAWHHIAVTIDATTSSSSTINLFVDGVLQNTFTSQNLSTQGTNYEAPSIGGNATTFVNNATGYITDVRMVKGSRVYTGNYTVPTAPLSAISGTLLLCNFTNAGIYDSASGNDLETVGNAQVSTVQAKWGTTSMAFDGTGDLLTAVDRPALRFGTAPFTIEGWVYLNVLNLAQGIASKRNATPTGWKLEIDPSNKLYFVFDVSSITSTLSIPASTWTHFAVVREGTGTNQTKLYINGVNSGTGTVANNFNQTDALTVGSDRGPGNFLNGYIDDLRITNGYARYTANFTPPTAAFPLN